MTIIQWLFSCNKNQSGVNLETELLFPKENRWNSEMMSVLKQLMLTLNLSQCWNDSQCTSKLKSPMKLFCLPLGLTGLLPVFFPICQKLNIFIMHVGLCFKWKIEGGKNKICCSFMQVRFPQWISPQSFCFWSLRVCM